MLAASRLPFRLAVVAFAAAGVASLAGFAPAAGSTDRPATPPPSAAASAADSYKIDPIHSSVIFRIKHLGTTNFYGQFNSVTGTIQFDESNPSTCSIQAEIPVESIDTHNKKRDSDVKGADLFNAAKFPTISFKSKSFTKTADGFDVAGDLTLHGETKPITVKLVKTGEGKGMGGNQIIGLEATMDIKRSDFGMSGMQRALGDEVRIIVSTEAGK